MKTWFWRVAAIALLAGFLPTRAEAVPHFRRNKDCSMCHQDGFWQYLNEKGRTYKLNGYRMDPGWEDEDYASVDSILPDDLPMSIRWKSYPWRDRDSKSADPIVDIPHETEVVFAGQLHPGWFYMAEWEAESPIEPSGFWAGHNMSTAVNWYLGEMSYAAMDPLDTLTDGSRRVTASHRAPFDIRAFSGQQRWRDNSNGFGMYGTSGGGTFYNLSATTGVSKNDHDMDFMGRVAHPFSDNFWLGGFYVNGTDDLSGTETDFSWTGFDVQWDLPSQRIMAVFMDSQNSQGATDVDYTAAYIEYAYFFESFGAGDGAFVVRYNDAGGDVEREIWDFMLSYQPFHNLKIAVEFNHDEISGDDGITTIFDFAV